MTLKRRDELTQEELEQQNGEVLPEREVMSVIGLDPQPVPVAEGELPGDETYRGEPME
jgi:hypothetical protein